jgi:trehalose/maltose hydrolase-like predicted phosphorylase
VEVAQEIHISGDVSFAAMQLWKATHDDTLLLPEHFGDLFLDIADFWIDRSVFNVSKNQFEIRGELLLTFV